MDDLLSALTPYTGMRERIKARLDGYAFFSDIPALLEDRHDINSEIDKALAPIEGQAGNAGACLIILPAKFISTKPDAAGPFFDNTSIVIRCVVNPIINTGDKGTKKSCVIIAFMTAALLHHFCDPGVVNCLNCESILPFQDEEYDIWDVTFKTMLTMKPTT